MCFGFFMGVGFNGGVNWTSKEAGHFEIRALHKPTPTLV
jgi:hypothetical protein